MIIAFNNFAQPWLIDREDAFIEVCNALLGNIQRAHFVPQIGKAGSSHKPYIADPDHSDVSHIFQPRFKIYSFSDSYRRYDEESKNASLRKSGTRRSLPHLPIIDDEHSLIFHQIFMQPL